MVGAVTAVAQDEAEVVAGFSERGRDAQVVMESGAHPTQQPDPYRTRNQPRPRNGPSDISTDRNERSRLEDRFRVALSCFPPPKGCLAPRSGERDNL